MHDQLPAYFDDELDAAQGHAFEEHLAVCLDCERELAELRGLRSALRNESLRHRPPSDLEGRVRKLFDPVRPVMSARRRWITMLTAAAALAAAILVGASLTLAVRIPPGDERLAVEVTSSHARSLLAEHLFDIASTDRHTVKPWFQGKTDFSPPVVDLKDQGFPLAGGRLDVLDGQTVAALVYRRHQHVINLFVWPAVDGGRSDVKTLTRRGYNLAHWTEAGLTFWAVSDLNANELAEFSTLVRDKSR